MGTKADAYLKELERKFGNAEEVRRHLKNFYGKDLGDDFEKYVEDYYETQVLKREEHKRDEQVKEEERRNPEIKKSSIRSNISYFLC
jgi:hypothetical protein